MLVRLALLVAVGFAAAAASAQDYPARNMTLVVPFAAGGSADIVGRLLAQSMSELLGRTIVVENVSGAGGMIGASRVAKAPPDGYQILLGTVATQALSQTLYRAPLYNSIRDFEPVGLAVDVPIILQVKNGFPADKPSAVIEYLKANRSKVSYGSPGAGTSNHLACALFNAAIGIDVTHVPYRAGADLFGDMIAGRLDYWCLTTTAAAPMIQANQVKTILAFSRQRLEILPNVPTARRGWPCQSRSRHMVRIIPSQRIAGLGGKDPKRCAWQDFSKNQRCRQNSARPGRWSSRAIGALRNICPILSPVKSISGADPSKPVAFQCSWATNCC